MPVYEQSYISTTKADFRPRSLVWMRIAWRGITQAWRKSGSASCWRFAWHRSLSWRSDLPGGQYRVLEFFGFNLSEFRDIFGHQRKFYYNFSSCNSFPVSSLPVLLERSDLRRPAHQSADLYLSKPIMRLDYLFGKAASRCSSCNLVSMNPCLLLVFLYAFFNTNVSYITQNGRLIFPHRAVGACLRDSVDGADSGDFLHNPGHG
jgi:hypothetical protein